MTIHSRFLRDAGVLVLSLFAFVVSGVCETTVGVIVPLSGGAADYGLAIRNSIELARERSPELFTDIRFEYEDATYDPRVALTAFQKLADSNHSDIIVTWGVSACKALAPVAEARKVPLIGICIDPETARGRRYVMRFMNTIDDYMQETVSHLRRSGMKKIVVLVSEHPYLAEMRAALDRTRTAELSIDYLDSIPPTEQDFRTHIRRIKQGSFDGVGVFLFVGQISTFFKQSKQLQLGIPTFGTNFFESASETSASEGAMNGSLFAGNIITPEFAALHQQRFGSESQLTFGVPAYAMAMTIGRLFNSHPAQSADDVMERLQGIGEQELPLVGKFRYAQDDHGGAHIEFPLTMKRVDGNRFEPIAK